MMSESRDKLRRQWGFTAAYGGAGAEHVFRSALIARLFVFADYNG